MNSNLISDLSIIIWKIYLSAISQVVNLQKTQEKQQQGRQNKWVKSK